MLAMSVEFVEWLLQVCYADGSLTEILACSEPALPSLVSRCRV